MKMNKFIFCFVTVLSSICLFTQTYAAESLDKIVATVNDSVVTQSELSEAISAAKKQIAQSNAPMPANDVLRKQILDQLINQKLQIQLAEQAGMTASDDEVDAAIKKVAEQNKVSVSELYQKAAEHGLSQSEYHKELRNQIMIQKLQQKEVGDKITITPQEVDDFLRSKSWQASNTKEYHLEDILVALPEAPSPEQVAETKKRAEAMLARVRKAKNFQEASAAEATNNNAVQGGDLGWRKLPEVPSAFADEIIHLKQGDIIGPIQTPNGFHIIYLAGIRSVGNPNSDAKMERGQVQQLIYQRKFEEALQSWILRIRSGATINMHPDN
jgi:peptidyl-prolyl cis-trans isomerase SurA